MTANKIPPIGVPALAATLLIGAMSILILGIQPIVLSALVADGTMNAAGMGSAAMVEILALAIGAMIGPFVMNGAMRVKCFTMAFFLLGVDLSIFFADSLMFVLVQRGAAGLLSGLLLGSVAIVITNSANPSRLSGLGLALAAVPQITGAYFLPPIAGLLHARIGFVFLACAAVVMLLVSVTMPNRVHVPSERSEIKLALNRGLILLIGSIFIQNCGSGAIWAYIDQFAAQKGLTPSATGAAIASSLALQMVSALIAAWISYRWRASLVIAIALPIQFLCVLMLINSAGPLMFTIALCGVGVFWTGLQPYQLMALIGADPTRRVAMLMGPITLIGASVGPFAASLFLKGPNVAPVFDAAWWMIGSGILIFYLFIMHNLKDRQDLLSASDAAIDCKREIPRTCSVE